jgi:integrase
MAVPSASAKAVQRSLRYWDEFCLAFGILSVTAWAVASYLLLRAAPPIDVPLPEWSRQTVAPFTASSEVGNLKRHLRDSAMARTLLDAELALLEAVASDLVRRVRRSLGANIRRTKTRKLPILWHMVSEALQAVCNGLISSLDREQLRNFTIVAIGLAVGLRRSKIVRLRAEHIRRSSTGFIIVIMEDKTNRCAGPHAEPKLRPIEHKLAC